MKPLQAETAEQINQEAVEWHVRVLSGRLADDEIRRFEEWRRQDPAHDKAFRDVEMLWRQLPEPLLADRRSRAGNRSYRHQATRRRRFLGVAAAASILISVVTGFFTDYLQNPLASHRTVIGEQSSITLADGSIVYLNTDTAIDVAFHDQERRITLLHGEAEFDVVHDRNRPFRVFTGQTMTEALGTRFLVRYDGAGAVTLLQGKTRTSRRSAQGAESNSITLEPSQRLSFNDQQIGSVQIVDPAISDAWRRGQLIMNFVSLKTVLDEINRYRRFPILLLDGDVGNREVNIAVDFQHIDAWLEALGRSMPIRISKIGPLVLVHS